jgi:Na+/H+ antiporter
VTFVFFVFFVVKMVLGLPLSENGRGAKALLLARASVSNSGGMMSVAEIFVGLLLAVAILAMLARKLHIPYPILFVIGGLLLGLIPGLPHLTLNPDLVFLFVLPPLLFPAALFTSWRDFRANLRPISLLAIGLVLFTTVTVAYLAHYFMNLPLAAGFVLGAIISPPDAIAATAIAERLSVPPRIITILEGESLVNDATALVAYRFAIVAVISGSFSLARASGQFFIVGIGGILTGLAIGWLAQQFHKRVDDAPIEITVSLLTPFAAYLTAERLGVSGVLAVVTAGLYLGRRMPELLTFKTRLQGGPVWQMVEFLLNGFVFILIGLQLPEVLRALSGHDIPIRRLVLDALLISLAVVFIRIIWVFPATYLPRLIFKKLCRLDPYPNWRNVTIVGVDGDARGGFACGGFGDTADHEWEIQRPARSGARFDFVPHFHRHSGHACGAGLELAAGHPLARHQGRRLGGKRRTRRQAQSQPNRPCPPQ